MPLQYVLNYNESIKFCTSQWENSYFFYNQLFVSDDIMNMLDLVATWFILS